MDCHLAGRAGRQRLCEAASWLSHSVLGSVLGALLCAISSVAQARTIDAASLSLTDVRTAIASAVDGDTVIVPAGTASWNSSVTITKAITIQGQTTTDIPNKTANDQTTLVDNLIRIDGGQGYFNVNSNSGTLARITGITFSGAGGLQTIMSNGAIRVNGSTPFRIDHCHFKHLHHSPQIGIYSANFGVADHNVFDDYVGNDFSIRINMPNYNGQQNGDGSYAEAAGFGGPKFFFIETNVFDAGRVFDQAATAAVDSFEGAKFVYRYNRVWNTSTLGHSTASTFLRGRGVRAQEIYNNEYHFSNGGTLDGTTGGSMLVHDNTFDGVLLNGYALQVYRAIYSYGPPFYGADGNSPWDYNVTEADGTHVDGHPPFLFESGTLTSASFPKLADSTKNWTTNQWVGYSITRPSDRAMGLIVANTSNTVAVASWQAVNFAAGNQYQIHKVLRVLDQPGTGRGDLLRGDRPVNTKTRTAQWPNPETEPCYSWNNIHSPGGEHLNFVPSVGAFTIAKGRDYFDDTPMPGYSPYTYPHPLTTGVVQPQANATRSSDRYPSKSSQPKSKKVKTWKWGKAKEKSADAATERVAPDR